MSIFQTYRHMYMTCIQPHISRHTYMQTYMKEGELTELQGEIITSNQPTVEVWKKHL